MAMTDGPKEFFPVSGARYELEDLFQEIEKTKWVVQKWQLMMKMYNRQLAFERTHQIAVTHMREKEGADAPLTNSSIGLNAAIAEYRRKLPEIEAIYKEEQKKQLARWVVYMVPSEKELKLIDVLEDRKNIFEGDWGILKQVNDQIQRTEQQIDQIKRSALMNPVEKRAEMEIQEFYLNRLRVAKRDVESLYEEYVVRFRVYKLM
jgi:hypothetical protein